MTTTALNSLVEELSSNTVIQSVLLRENEGFTADIGKRLYQSILAKAQETNEGMLSANARLNKISARVSWLLKSWMRLQCEETRDVIEQTLSHSMTTTMMSASRTSMNNTIQRLGAAVREHNIREIHRPYSVFSYLLEDEDENSDNHEVARNRLMSSLQDNPLILYDLEEDDQQPHGNNNGSQPTSSQALTNRFVIEPYQSKGFENLEYSKRYIGDNDIHEFGKNRKDDELDLAIPSSSPHAHNGKKHHEWEYWPEEKRGHHHNNGHGER